MVPDWPPIAVMAHGFTDAGALPVPTPLLLALCLGAVAAAAALPARHGAAVPSLAACLSRPAVVALRVTALVMVVLITVPAAFGPTDAALNPAPRLLFTVGWAGLLLLSAVIGGWWAGASPLALAADDTGDASPPAVVWPAAGALVAFGVAEQVAEPTSLVVLSTLGVYLVAGVAGGLLRGRQWLAANDPVHVTSSVVGAIAPLGRSSAGRVQLRSPRRTVAGWAAPDGLAFFLGALIGINIFDALSDSGSATARLGLYAVCVAGGAAVVHVAARPQALAVAFIPAAVGHLGAHYLAPLLVDTQIAAVLASDPLRLGWNLLGLTGREIVAEPIPPTAGLAVQVVLLVAGHAVAMAVASDVAARHLSRRAAGPALFPVRAAIMASLVLGVYLRVGLAG